MVDIIEAPVLVPEGTAIRITFKVLDHTGDTRFVWDGTDTQQCFEAKRKFDEFIQKGLMAFQVGADGRQGSRIEKFDPTAEEIIFCEVPAGG